MKKLASRIFYGLLFAIPLMLLTFALAQASPAAQGEQPPGPAPECAGCHMNFQESWAASGHGKTGSVPCQSCHTGDVTKHPTEPMGVQRSAQLCSTCHNETFYQWEVSGHSEKGLDCAGCHDPHATSLKEADSSKQCATCHRERSTGFTHTAHNEQGLVCADCHLNTSEDENGKLLHDHSFQVMVGTCFDCHDGQLHGSVMPGVKNELVKQEKSAASDALASVETLSVVPEPDPASPIGFAILAGVLGLAAGAVLGPWFERWFRRGH